MNHETWFANPLQDSRQSGSRGTNHTDTVPPQRYRVAFPSLPQRNAYCVRGEGPFNHLPFAFFAQKMDNDKTGAGRKHIW